MQPVLLFKGAPVIPMPSWRGRVRNRNTVPRFFQPALERLEARTLLATAIWTGNSPFTPSWSDFGNWAGFYRPNPFDDIVFPAGPNAAFSFNDSPPETPYGTISFPNFSPGF